jgi:hypothetical protein
MALMCGALLAIFDVDSDGESFDLIVGESSHAFPLYLLCPHDLLSAFERSHRSSTLGHMLLFCSRC